MSARIPERPSVIDRPDFYGAEPGRLLVTHLDWHREAVLRKGSGLADEQLRQPVEPLGWSILGVVKHLGWVERRWLRWGFEGQQVQATPEGAGLGNRSAEFVIFPDEQTETVFERWQAEVDHSRAVVAGTPITARASLGGRFTQPEELPTLGDILFHLVQEYARHVGQLDIARELIDGAVGE